MQKSKLIVPFLLVVAAAIFVLPTVIGLIKGTADTPGVFADAYTLTQAAELSKETGKPMLVLATADWCPPCQTLKRTTLVDPTVVEWIKANTIPVYLEDAVNGEEIGGLGVRSYPTTMLIQDDKVLVSVPGAVKAGSFVRALSAAIPATPKAP